MVAQLVISSDTLLDSKLQKLHDDACMACVRDAHCNCIAAMHRVTGLVLICLAESVTHIS